MLKSRHKLLRCLTNDGDLDEVLGAPGVYEAPVPRSGLELQVNVPSMPHVIAGQTDARISFSEGHYIVKHVCK